MHANKEIIKKLHPGSVSRPHAVLEASPTGSEWNEMERFRSKTERHLVPCLTSLLSRTDYFVIRTFCLSLAGRNRAVLTSNLSGPDFQKHQRLHLLEPQCPSRVVKVRQASQKTAPSSLDVKAPILPLRHIQAKSPFEVRYGREICCTTSLTPPQKSLTH